MFEAVQIGLAILDDATGDKHIIAYIRVRLLCLSSAKTLVILQSGQYRVLNEGSWQVVLAREMKAGSMPMDLNALL